MGLVLLLIYSTTFLIDLHADLVIWLHANFKQTENNFKIVCGMIRVERIGTVLQK